MTWPRLLFVGPHLGRHAGWVLSQGEILAGLFRDEGHAVAETSSRLNPLLRAADMVVTLWRRRRNFDAVVLSCYSGRAFRYTELIGFLCERWQLPLVIVLHGGALPELFVREAERAKKALSRARMLVAPSNYLADAATDLGLEARVIPNVLELGPYQNLERTAADPKRPRLLWMRTFHEVYHPELALETLAILRQRGLGATLTLAGQDKGLEAACRKRALELGLAEHVRFPGFLDLAGKFAAFAHHDVFLNTNRIDNSPVSVLEAAAAGLPIVATAAGGIPKLLASEKEALLVPIGDAAAMADAVCRLFTEDGLPERLAAGGRRVAAASAWPNVYASWLRIFQEALPTTTTNSPLSEGRAASSACSAPSEPRSTSS